MGIQHETQSHLVRTMVAGYTSRIPSTKPFYVYPSKDEAYRVKFSRGASPAKVLNGIILQASKIRL